MSSFLKALTVVPVVTILALMPGCDAPEPECSCSVDSIDFPAVRSVEDTVTTSFTITNSGDADRLTYLIEPDPAYGLSVIESPIYVLDEGESMTYTLVYAPQDSVPSGNFDFRVGDGEDCRIAVSIGGAASPRPIGSCCFDDGSCQQNLVLEECEDLGGRFNGVGSTCADAVCRGACCLVVDGTGACAQDTVMIDGETVIQQITAADCTALGGTYRGDGTNCASIDCPDPAPGCAIADTSFVFEFDLTDLTTGTVKADTFAVRNPGLGVLESPVPVAVCSFRSDVTFEALTNAGEDGQLFSIAPGDSALIEIRVRAGASGLCEYTFSSSAPQDEECEGLRVERILDFSTGPSLRRTH